MEEVIFERRWELHIESLSLPEPMRVLMEEERWGCMVIDGGSSFLLWGDTPI
jgi:hypothetical protein